jgi:hypothetical protein
MRQPRRAYPCWRTASWSGASSFSIRLPGGPSVESASGHSAHRACCARSRGDPRGGYGDIQEEVAITDAKAPADRNSQGFPHWDAVGATDEAKSSHRRLGNGEPPGGSCSRGALNPRAAMRAIPGRRRGRVRRAARVTRGAKPLGGLPCGGGGHARRWPRGGYALAGPMAERLTAEVASFPL